MGNEFIFEGKKYISAARASKLCGYTADYIGQLCRKGHLDCRRVGLVWFVEESSVQNHKIAAKQSPRGRIPFSKPKPSNFEGKNYIPATQASKSSGYSSDYIGQLCRKGLLDCRRVGRVWFVEAESLKNHKIAASQTPRGRIPFSKKNLPPVVFTPGTTVHNVVERSSDSLAPADLNSTSSVVAPIELFSFKSDLQPVETVANVENQKKQSRFFFQKVVAGALLVLFVVVAGPVFIYSNFVNHTDSLVSNQENIAQETIALVTEKAKNYKAEAGDSVAYSASVFHSLGQSIGDKILDVTYDLGNRMAYVVDFFRNTTDRVKLAFTDPNNLSDRDGPRERAGVVVVPSAGDDEANEQVKEYILSSFSDETQVVPDESGNSGVIKPIFKDQSDQEYLYVVVPVKE